MPDFNEENILKAIKEKGIEAINADPKSFFKELGVEITDRQAKEISKQLNLLKTNTEEHILNVMILLS